MAAEGRRLWDDLASWYGERQPSAPNSSKYPRRSCVARHCFRQARHAPRVGHGCVTPATFAAWARTSVPRVVAWFGRRSTQALGALASRRLCGNGIGERRLRLLHKAGEMPDDSAHLVPRLPEPRTQQASFSACGVSWPTAQRHRISTRRALQNVLLVRRRGGSGPSQLTPQAEKLACCVRGSGRRRTMCRIVRRDAGATRACVFLRPNQATTVPRERT